MEHSKPRGKEPAIVQAWASPHHEESRLPLFTDLANSNELAITDQAGDAVDSVEPVVCASLRLQDPDFVKNPRLISLKAWEEIGSTMELVNFFSYQNSLNQAISNIDSLQDRFIVLHDIRAGCEKQDQPQERMKSVHDWIRDQIEKALDEIEQVEENDGRILVLIAKKYAKEITMNRITCFANKHSSNSAFAIEFAFSLYDELVSNTMDAGFAAFALAQILSAAVPALCSRGSFNWPHHQAIPLPASVNASNEDQNLLQADRMARLVRCCLTVGLYTEEHALLRHIWQFANSADAPTLQRVYLPYLKNLLQVMQDYFIPLTTPNYQWQFQLVISLLIIRYIGKEPTPLPPDLSCPPLGCASPTRPYPCSTCLELDAILVDPHRRTGEVTGNIDAPDHVANQIQGTDYLQMTVLTHSAEQMMSTIRITKNITKPEEPDERHELWKKRAIKANDMIQAICGDEEWKLLLGNRYDECMQLRAVRAE